MRPSDTPDVKITSTTPGEGNFPEVPKYLAPPMPWPTWRHMSDEDLWAIAAYLKHGLKPVKNGVEDSEGPRDFWASLWAQFIGPWPALPFPTANEVLPAAGTVDPELVGRGRQEVIEHACGLCHGGGDNPAGEGWLAGVTDSMLAFQIDSLTIFPRNLTPDVETGLGRFSERQIFNALRYGLRPSETPDVEINSSTPGEGNFPENPRYLAPAMPWTSWRHMADEDLWALVAYLKHGVRPVRNVVPDNPSPPDFWASAFTVDQVGPYPAPPFPTTREMRPEHAGREDREQIPDSV